jgi:hypothetical protein
MLSVTSTSPLMILNQDCTVITCYDTHHKYLKNSFVFLLLLHIGLLYFFIKEDGDWLLKYYFAFNPDMAHAIAWGSPEEIGLEKFNWFKERHPINSYIGKRTFFIENSPFIFLLSLCFYFILIFKTKPKVFIDREHGIAYSYIFNRLYISRFEDILAKNNLYEGAWPPFHMKARHTNDHPRGPLFLCLQRYQSKRTATFWLGDHPATSTYMNTELKEAIIGFMTDYESKTEEQWRKAFDIKHSGWLSKMRSKTGEFSLFPDRCATLPKKVQKQLEEYLASHTSKP